MKKFFPFLFLSLFGLTVFADGQLPTFTHLVNDCTGTFVHQTDVPDEPGAHYHTCTTCGSNYSFIASECPICNPNTPHPPNPDDPDNPSDKCPHCGSSGHTTPSPSLCGCVIDRCYHCNQDKPCQHSTSVHDCGCVSSTCDHCKRTIKCQHVRDEHVCNCIRTYCEHCHQQNGCQHQKDYDHDCGCIGGEICDHCGERKGCQHDPQHQCVCIPFRCDHCGAQIACKHVYDDHDCGCAINHCNHCHAELPCQHVKNDHDCGCVYVTCDHCGGKKGCQHEPQVNHDCGCVRQTCDHCHADKGCQHEPQVNHDCGCIRRYCDLCGADIGCQHQTVDHNCDGENARCSHCGSRDHTKPSVSACGCLRQNPDVSGNRISKCSHCGGNTYHCFCGFKNFPCQHPTCHSYHVHEPPCRSRTCPKCNKQYCATHDLHNCDKDPSPDPDPEPDDPYTPPDNDDFDAYEFKFIKLLKQKIRIDLPDSFEVYTYDRIPVVKDSFVMKLFYDYGLYNSLHKIFNMDSGDMPLISIANFCRTASIILMSIVFIIALVKSVKKNS